MYYTNEMIARLVNNYYQEEQKMQKKRIVVQNLQGHIQERKKNVI